MVFFSLRCNLCGKGSSSKCNLARHVKQVHAKLNDERILRDFTNKVFFRKSSHAIDGYICEIKDVKTGNACGRKLEGKKALNDHRVKVHEKKP